MVILSSTKFINHPTAEYTDGRSPPGASTSLVYSFNMLIEQKDNPREILSGHLHALQDSLDFLK